jgi:branched-chain amino acid transport system permease protein
MNKSFWAGRIALLALFCVLPWILYPPIALDIVAFGLFATAFDIVFGYLGLLSFGHAAFWGTSAYVTANMLQRGHSVPLAILCGMLSALLLSLPMGFLSIRSVGIYFSMITLAFGQMIDFIAKQSEDFTGGDNGLPGLPQPALFGVDMSNTRHGYYVLLAIAIAGFIVAARTIHSPFGRVMVAIRDNETRAQSIGYDPLRYKLIAFVISATLAGLAGAIFCVGHGVVSLDVVNWTTSGLVVMMTLLGGSGTLLGPVVGGAIVLLLRDQLSTHAGAVGVVTGLVFVLTVLFFRKGVVGTLLHEWERRRAPQG